MLCYTRGMSLQPSQLPDDTASLKQIITSQQQQIDHLQEMLRLLQNELFGRKSERHPAEDTHQLPLFTPAVEPVKPVAADAPIEVKGHHRKKRGRKPLPANLPRIEMVHDIAEDDKHCACGAVLSRIGEERCEKLDYIPAKIRVICHIRPKYACRNCEGVDDSGPTVRIAPAPVALIPKSIATEGLLAHVAVAKFADALPLYRQQKIFNRLGVDLPRATLANWMIQAAERCGPLMDLLVQEIRSGPLINIDESPLQVLGEPGRSNTTKSFMWVFCGGPREAPVVLYQYHPTRSGQTALKLIDDYQGYIQTDGFSGYDHLHSLPGITHLGCLVHVRRKFKDVVKARKKPRGKQAATRGLADEALDFIAALYRIESQAREQELGHDEIRNLRQQQARPVLDQLKAWLEVHHPQVPPKSLLGKAMQYALNQWDRLVVYTTAGFLTPDNNVAENAIRPFVLGRKNWLFAGAPRGANASATFFSLIETAKANGLEPYAYLRYLFANLPLAHSTKKLRALLPNRVNHNTIEALEKQVV
jgi:transposase